MLESCNHVRNTAKKKLKIKKNEAQNIKSWASRQPRNDKWSVWGTPFIPSHFSPGAWFWGVFASLIFVLLVLITAKDQICEHRPKCVFSCTRALRTQVAPKVKVYTRYNVAQVFRTEALKVCAINLNRRARVTFLVLFLLVLSSPNNPMFQMFEFI